MESAERRPRSVHVRIERIPPALRGPHTLPSGDVVYRGTSLRTLRERLGGHEGEATDHWGGRHQISLAEWRDADPDTTFLGISFSPDAQYTAEEELLTWRDVPRAAWLSAEELVRAAFQRARVTMINEWRDGLRGSPRHLEIGRRILPAAHFMGVRHVALHALTPAQAADANRERSLPDHAEGLLGQEETRTFVHTALELGWTVWGFGPDPERLAAERARGEEWAELAWRVREESRTVDAMMERLDPDAKLLVWFANTNLLWWGPHWEAGIPDPPDQPVPEFANLTPEEAFVIDQTAAVPHPDHPESQEWCERFIAGLRPILESFGGSAGILREDAGDPLRLSPGGDAFLLSTDNAVE